MKYLSLLTSILLLACHSSNDKATITDSTIGKKPTGFDVKQIAGVFIDTLPCADCPGIATAIYLKPDNSFVMEQAYIGKSIVYDVGRWSVTDSILKLTGTEEGPRQFKILSHAEIKLLDNEGRMIYDTTSRHVSLHRNNIPFRPKQPVPVEGVFSATGDTMNILVCAMGNIYPVALAPAAMNIKTAYNKAAHQKNEPVYAKLEGHFELRPALKDTSTKDFFVVERFIKFIPGQQCK